MGDRVVLGRRLAGVGAARRIGVELLEEDGRADDPGEGLGADEPLRGSGHHDADAVPGERGEPRELHRLVGGDAAGDADQYSCHWHIVPESGEVRNPPIKDAGAHASDEAGRRQVKEEVGAAAFGREPADDAELTLRPSGGTRN